YALSSYRSGSSLNAGAELAAFLNGYNGKQDGRDVLPGERPAVARVQNGDTIALGQAALLAVDRVDELALRWQREVVPLLSNEEGRALATAPDLVRAFRKAWEQAPSAPPEVALARAQVKSLIEPAQQALADRENTATTSAETTTRL